MFAHLCCNLSGWAQSLRCVSSFPSWWCFTTREKDKVMFHLISLPASWWWFQKNHGNGYEQCSAKTRRVQDHFHIEMHIQPLDLQAPQFWYPVVQLKELHHQFNNESLLFILTKTYIQPGEDFQNWIMKLLLNRSRVCWDKLQVWSS